MEEYIYVKSLYKKKGRNYKIYYHGKSKKLKDFTDDELVELSKHLKNGFETFIIHNSHCFIHLANHENVEDFIIKRRFKKIIKLKNKIKINRFKRFLKL